MILPGLAVVVCPLISLMKDQVDALTGAGIEAAFLNSSLGMTGQRAVCRALRAGRLKILYVAPERLVTEAFIALLSAVRVSYFAVDEAHCISMWGHDFRPEYRALKRLRSAFPKVAVHAYTATATEPVREDIGRALGLKEAETLVGSFDRPNLILKAERRTDCLQQVKSVLAKHESQSIIIYCIRRRDADGLASALSAGGYSALSYHAGMTDEARKANQEAFLTDRAKIIVATMAFGMGIDKPNVRCVIHAGAPKSLEQYQQECGRAGRDGLAAECRLFFSGSDFFTWRRFIDGMDPEPRAIAFQKLNDMYDYCAGLACRHRILVNHFGQTLERGNCKACDVCLGEIVPAEQPLITSQKILSCVVRLRERYGVNYTASVLCGSRDLRILGKAHERLSTWGLLSDDGFRNVRDWVEQLVSQKYLEMTGDFNVLRVTGKGWKVLRGEEVPNLLKPAE
jgi:ATP-dependent DNA helicase RecQ